MSFQIQYSLITQLLQQSRRRATSSGSAVLIANFSSITMLLFCVYVLSCSCSDLLCLCNVIDFCNVCACHCLVAVLGDCLQTWRCMLCGRRVGFSVSSRARTCGLWYLRSTCTICLMTPTCLRGACTDCCLHWFYFFLFVHLHASDECLFPWLCGLNHCQ